MKLYRAGATICINDAAQLDPAIGRLTAAVRAQLNFVGNVDVRAYLSPDGQGYQMHFDSRVATTLQISGQKRWRFSAQSALPWPHYQVRTGADGQLVTDGRVQQPLRESEAYVPPDACSFEEVVLGPGDLLCLPAGTWHEASAIGHSLALNLAFESTGAWDVLEPVIAARLRTHQAWREPPPLVATGGVHSGEWPASVDGFFKDRLTMLIDVLEELRDDPGAVAQSWQRRIVHGLWSATPARPSRDRAPNLPVTPSTRLRRSSSAVAYGFGRGPNDEQLIFVYCVSPPAELSYSENARPFIERVLTATEFVAAETRAWGGDGRDYSWQSVQALLEDLVACGVLDVHE
jgi:hypothetical protein